MSLPADSPKALGPSRRWGTLIAGFLFLLSGFAALIDQVVWQRVLGIVSGVHLYSVTVIVTAFMAGLGVGSLLGGRFADRLSPHQAILCFAGCELTIAAFAATSPWLYYDVVYVRAAALLRYPLALPLVHFALLLVPTTLMGGSLPFLSRALVERTEGAAQTIGLLYSLNTVGAGVGAFATVWSLVSRWGFVGALYFGAALNLVVAVGACVVAPRLRSRLPVPRVAPSEAESPRGSLGYWAFLAGLSGFVALSFEIVWFRVLDVAIKSSPYTFGHLLGVFLCCLGFGSLLGTLLVARSTHPGRVYLWSQWGIAATAGISLVLFFHLPAAWPPMGVLRRYWRQPEGLEIEAIFKAWADRSESRRAILSQAALVYLGVPFGLLTASTFLMGFAYPYLQKAVQNRFREVGWRVGLIQTSNIAGCLLGSWLTGTVALDLLGTSRSLALLVLSGAVFGILAAREALRGRLVLGSAAVLGSALLALALPSPTRFWARLHGTVAENLVVAEDATGVTALRVRGPLGTIRINGRGHGQVPYGGIHTLLGVIPVLLRFDMESALIVGMGSGNTAWAAGSGPRLRRIEVYEIVATELPVLRELVGRAPAPGAQCVRRFLDDRRIRLSFTDGRIALRAAEGRFDLIEADGLEPSMAFSGSLYSREFFQLCRSRLSRGGVLCTYVPSSRTLRTLARSFPHLLDFHLEGSPRFVLGSEEALRFDRATLRERLHSPWVQSYFEGSGVSPDATQAIEDFLDAATITPITGTELEMLSRGDLNTDLFPRDEFSASE